MSHLYKSRGLKVYTKISYQRNKTSIKKQLRPRNAHQKSNSNRSHRLSHSTTQPEEQATTLPLPNGPLFERSLLIPLWKKIRTIGPGFVNSQNNCFLNSVLECLTYTPALAQYFLIHGHRNQCTSIRFCAMCAMDHHVHRCLEEPKSLIKGAAILPRAFTSNLQTFSPNLSLGNQEDAHEFLMFLLDAIHKSTIQGYGKLDANMERTAFVYQIFGGQLRSQLRCRSCNAKSDTFDNFLDLSVDLQKATSVHSALEDFIKVDIIGDNDPDTKYLCNSCEQKVNAEKQITVHELPSYLCVHLKRFTFDLHCGYMRKVTKDIKYGEMLDMAPYVSEGVDFPSTVYQLYAVLVHFGDRCDWGHYFAYVKAPDGEWFRMDDEDVSPAPLDEVLSQQVYMLFYSTQQHTTAPVDTKNTATIEDILSKHTANGTEIKFQHLEANGMDLTLAKGKDISAAVAATATVIETTAQDEKTTTTPEMVAHAKDETVDYQQALEDSVEAPSEGCEYFVDKFNEWIIEPSCKPARSLRGNMSPPTFSAAVSDISSWTIQDLNSLDNANKPWAANGSDV
ncbi:unnamed protein product [Absidia cylindrospora]